MKAKESDPDAEPKTVNYENVSSRTQDWEFVVFISFALLTPFGENIPKIIPLTSQD